MVRVIACFVLWCCCMSAALAADRYGGIEIGAKGVKFAAIEVAGGKLREIPVPKDAVNVSIARMNGAQFDKWDIADVATVVKSAKETMMTELGIPESNIRVVASSGVPTFATNQQALVDAITTATGLKFEKILPAEEAALTNLALIPAERRSDTMVVDIGSGNTKGGAFQNGSGQQKDFVAIDVKFGTSSLARKISQEVGNGAQSASQVAASIARTEIGAALQNQVRLNPVLGQRSNILFSGGSVWAMTTFIKPQAALDAFPQISMNDIAAYKKLIESSLPGYPTVDFSTISNPDAQKIAKADYDRITGAGGSAVFKPEELFAGAILLEEVAKALDFQNRAVMFDRKAMTAWITAKITPEPLRDQLPRALRRELPPVPPVPPVPQDGNKAADPFGAKTLEVKPGPMQALAGNSGQNTASPLQPSVPSTGQPMEAVQVWHDETVYESRAVCYWTGCGWTTVCECVPVTRTVCETQWMPVAAAPSPAPRMSAPVAAQASDFRLWTNDQGKISKFQLRPVLVAESWIVFETTSNQLISHPLGKLSGQDRELLAKQTGLKHSSKLVSDVTGQHHANMTLLRVADSLATYLKTNGKIIYVPLAQLSVEDRALASSFKPSAARVGQASNLATTLR